MVQIVFDDDSIIGSLIIMILRQKRLIVYPRVDKFKNYLLFFNFTIHAAQSKTLTSPLNSFHIQQLIVIIYIILFIYIKNIQSQRLFVM